MIKVTVSFTTNEASDTDSARQLINDWRDDYQVRNFGVTDLAFVSAEAPAPSRAVTVADLVSAGVSPEAAERIVNG